MISNDGFIAEHSWKILRELLGKHQSRRKLCVTALVLLAINEAIILSRFEIIIQLHKCYRTFFFSIPIPASVARLRYLYLG